MPLDSVPVLSILDRVTDSDGNPVPGAVIYFYEAGTSTPKTVYSDANLSVSLGTSVTCDSGGFPTSDGSAKCQIYTGTASYKITIKTSAGATLWTLDNIKGAVDLPDASSIALPQMPVVYKTSAYSILTTDRGKLFKGDPTGGSFAFTLPSAVTAGDGFMVGVRHSGDTTQNVITIRTTGGQYISKPGHETATSFSLTGEGETALMVSDGAQWTAYAVTEPYMPGRTPFTVVSDRLTAPPSSPVGGNRYIINGTPTGAWATLGFAQHQIAESDGNGSWVSYNPGDGWLAYVADENLLTQYRDTTWVDLSNVAAPTSSTLKIGVFLDQRADGTTGGTATTTAWTTSTIQTTATNTLASAALAANVVTVGPGNYLIVAARYMERTNSAGLRIKTGSSNYIYGLPGTTGTDSAHLSAIGFLSVASGTDTIELQYYASNNSSANDLGRPLAIAGNLETYATLSIIDLTSMQGPQGAQGPQGDVGPTGDGWAPLYAVVSDGARRVMQIVGWTGGSGSAPATGDYLGPTGHTAVLASATDIRGPTGLTGAGTGDLLAANNLSDVANTNTAVNNLGIHTVTTVTGSVTVATTGASPQYHITSGTGTVTLNAATGYPGNFVCSIHNDSTRRWTIAPNGRTSYYLWPGQSCRVARVGSVWVSDYPAVWTLDAANRTIYVDHAAGSSANDGLTSGSAKATIQQAIEMIERYIDAFQFGIVIQVAAGTFTENAAVHTKRLRGYHVISLVGDTTTPSNCVWRIPANGTGLTCRDWSGIILGGFRMQAFAQTATMTIATPAVVTATAHGLAAGNTIVFSTTGALPTGVTAGTIYYVIATGLTTDTFQFSATSGGAAINTSGSQSGTHTVTAAGCTGISASQHGIIDIDRMDWGYMPYGNHIESTNGGSVGYVTGTTETISSSFSAHWVIGPLSSVLCTGTTIDLPAAVAMSSFVQMTGGSCVLAGNTYTGLGAGTGATGIKALVSLNGVLVSGATTAVTMTIATPAVATLTSHYLVADSEVIFTTTGALPTGVTAGTSYYVIATGLTANSFQFSASVGGAAVNTSGTQSGTHYVSSVRLPGSTAPLTARGGQIQL